MAAIESASVITSLEDVLGDGYTAGKLTTTFTYDAGCTGDWWQSRYSLDDPETERNMASLELDNACQPLQTAPVYSPGICPEGMTIPTLIEYRHSTYTKGDRGDRLWYGQCCTEGMSLFTSNGASYCSEIADTPMTVYRPVWKTVLTTIDGTPTTTIDLDLTQTSPGNTTVIEGATKIDKGVAVMWRATDLPDFPENYASILAKRFDIEYTPSGASTTLSNSISPATPEAQSRSSASLASPTSTSSASPTPAPTPSLSSGAKAGLGIGVALLALLSILGALFIAKRRRKAKQKQHNVPELHAEEQNTMAELSGKDKAQCAGVVEETTCMGVVVAGHELDGKAWKAELDGTSPVYELKGDDVERR